MPLAQALFDNLAKRMYTLTDKGHRLPRGLGWAGRYSTKVGEIALWCRMDVLFGQDRIPVSFSAQHRLFQASVALEK